MIRSALFAMLGMSALAVRAQSPWVPASSPTTQDLYGVCCSETGQFVAVGAGGTILTSPDGQHWTAQSSGTTATLRAVSMLWNLYAAVGDNGTLLTSPDGATWNSVLSGGAALDAMAQTAPQTEYIVGQGGAAFHSNDNVHWTAIDVGTTITLRGAFAQPNFQLTAVGDAGTLVMWNAGTPYVFNIGTSSNLNALSLVTCPSASALMVVGDGGYCALQGSSEWSAIPLAVTANLNAISAGGAPADTTDVDEVVVVGDGGTTLVGTSPDTPQDLTWKVVPSGTSNNLLGVASNGLTVVAVGQGGTILVAPNGITAPGLTGPMPVAPVPVPVGSADTLTVSPTTPGTFTYQWTWNGQPIPGATSSSLSLPDIQLNQSGSYVVTANNGFATSTFSFTVDVAYLGTMPGLIDLSFQPTYGDPQLPIMALSNGDVLTATYWLYGNGAVNATFNPSFSVFYALAQSNGQPIVVGEGVDGPVAQRYNMDGSVDTTWSTDLTADPEIGYVPDGAEPSVALPSGGFLSVFNDVVVRLGPNGQFDASYTPQLETSTGLQPTTFTPQTIFTSELPAAAIDAAAGWVWVAGDPSNQSIYRFLADGTPDAAFAVANVTVPVQGLHAQKSHVYYYGNLATGDGQFTAGRLNGDGSVDPAYQLVSLPSYYVKAATYGTDGSLYIDYSEGIPAPDGLLFGFSEQPGDLPWFDAGGTYPALPSFNGTYREGVVRFDPNGNFDPAFSLNLDGAWPQSTASADANITWMGFAPSGQLYIAGQFPQVQGVTVAGLARLNLSAATATAILENVSARGSAGPGAQTMTGGFVIGNGGSKLILLRAVGPTLASFGVSDVLSDPKLTMLPSPQDLLPPIPTAPAFTSAEITSAEAAVRAFPLPAGSADIATLNILKGTSTFSIGSLSGDTGAVLLEAYDADAGPLTVSSPQLVNVSARGVVALGNPLVGGFVITQGNTKRVLIRADGPSLSQFGVANPLPDPVLALYSGQELIAAEQGWSTWQALLQPTFAAVGAFSFPANSLDSALVVTLPPGGYTAQITSASGATGEAMVEIYAVP